MKVFLHHIYEYQKGLRSLILHTIDSKYREIIIKKLNREKIPFLIRAINEKRINVFFGNRECIRVIELFGDKQLNEYSDEEDFILGVMLGYSRDAQCRRYLKRKGRLQIRESEKLSS